MGTAFRGGNKSVLAKPVVLSPCHFLKGQGCDENSEDAKFAFYPPKRKALLLSFSDLRQTTNMMAMTGVSQSHRHG